MSYSLITKGRPFCCWVSFTRSSLWWRICGWSPLQLPSSRSCLWKRIRFGTDNVFFFFAFLKLIIVFQGRRIHWICNMPSQYAWRLGKAQTHILVGSSACLEEDVRQGSSSILFGPQLKQINDKISQMGFIKRTLFNTALNSKIAAIKSGTKTWVDWDSLVFNKMKAMLGGRVRWLFHYGQTFDIVDKGLPCQAQLLSIQHFTHGSKLFSAWKFSKGLAAKFFY